MIGVTIAQESSRLMLADMLNAAMMGADLLEIRLDTLGHVPPFREIIAAKRRPLLFSCRRPHEGGNWQGSETDRQMLLRQAIMAKADYVEIEWDIADDIAPFPGCQRVISYTNLEETPVDIADIYRQMQQKHPDIIKITCKAGTPEEAWPLVQILNKPPVPTVIVGLGRPGLMLAVLGRKMGSPWTPVALERGSETSAGQPTLRDMEEIYAYRELGRGTKLVAVAGMGERESYLAGLLNVAFAEESLPVRCLPMQVGNLKLFKRMCEAVRIQGMVMEEAWWEHLHEIARLDETARSPVAAADLLIPSDEGYLATNSIGCAALNALEATIREREPDCAEPLRGRMMMFAGTGPLVRLVAHGAKARGAGLIFASKDLAEAQKLGAAFGGRAVKWEAIYQTMHDVLVVGRDGGAPEIPDDDDELPVHPGYLRASMYVLDMLASVSRSKMLREAKGRGCGIVTPKRLLVEHARAAFERIAGTKVSADVLMAKMDQWIEDGEAE